MSLSNNIDDVLHRIRCKLYPNYLANTKGAYIARINSEASLTVEQVCATLKNRRGFTGNYDDLIAYVNQFLDEVGYHVCDGYIVNMRYYSVYTSISGTFDSANEVNDRKKHHICFNFRANQPLRELAKYISLEVEDVLNNAAYIDRFTEAEGRYGINMIAQGDMFIVEGHMIKIAGDAPDIGLYFVSVENPAKTVKAERLGENNPSKILGIAPKLPGKRNRVEIKTQYCGASGRMLKEPRVIKGDFIVDSL